LAYTESIMPVTVSSELEGELNYLILAEKNFEKVVIQKSNLEALN
jgi:hypothetical protein